MTAVATVPRPAPTLIPQRAGEAWREGPWLYRYVPRRQLTIARLWGWEPACEPIHRGWSVLMRYAGEGDPQWPNRT